MDDRVAQDARIYRGHVRPRITGRIPFNTPQEHTLMHDFFVQRGLKVKPHTYSFYDASTHTMHHPTPEDKPAVAKAYLGWMDKPVKLARKPKANDPRAHEEALRGFMQAIRNRPYTQVDPTADPNVVHAYERWRAPIDRNAHLALADWIRDITGNPADPRATVVEKHEDRPEQASEGRGYLYTHGGYGHRPEPAYPTGHARQNGLVAQVVGPAYTPAGGPASHAVVSWHLPVPAARYANGVSSGINRSDYHTFTARLDPNEFHDLIDQLPEKHRQAWREYATRFGLHDTRGPQKLERVPGQGAAVRAQQTDTHATRLAIARQILQEAGIHDAFVRSVQAHTDNRGVRPGVSVALGSPVPPALSRYLAAWLGLMTGERKMTVFHPGEGEDVMHIIDSPHDQAHVGGYLRSAGIPTFTLEPSPGGTGTRAYIVDPMNLLNVGPAVSGLQASAHSQVPGTAVRLGDGDSDKGARADFRQVISDSEKTQ